MDFKVFYTPRALHPGTAIASDPARNLDFYTQVLGLRFLKRTINFDDPGTYHFYFGDDIGSPGTILTFFPWPNASKGRTGAGEVIATAFSIPADSFNWTEQLKGKDVAFTVTEMGFSKLGEEAGLVRFAPEAEAFGRFVDVKLDPTAPMGPIGLGTVHHIAFRNVNDAAQAEWRQILGRHLSVTTVQDRDYFHSIYFPEPGGVLFEMASDNPGFLIDEPIESLGEALRIPEWFEPMRRSIEARLAPLTLHEASQPALTGVTE